MPAPTFNQSTASAASGDIVISITPTATNNLELVCTSAFSSGHLSGWTNPNSGFYWRTSPNTSLLTFDLASPSPGPEWTAIMLDLPTLTTPAIEQSVAVDFGSWPTVHPYTHTFSGGTALNAGDCIIWCFTAINRSAPTGLSVSDSQGNTYNTFQFTQLIDGLYYTSLFAIAFGASAGVCTTNFDITTPTGGTNQGFALSLFVFSGLAVPPPIPPISQVVLNFQDPSGAPLANGSVQLRLTQDASAQFAGGPQIAAGRVVTAQLDANGSVTVGLRATVGLFPTVMYEARAFTSRGLPVWNGSFIVTPT